jgi:vitamin-K-epoxide reductase (warfarin-sensitive)
MPAAITRNSGWILLVIALLSAGGVVVSSLSLYHHYGTSKSSYCDFGGNFNCDMVNRSIYSTVLGVPVALIGILGYAGLLALATVYKARAATPAMMLLGSVAGLGFALYLTYVEAYVLAVWCVLCLSSLGLITTIAGFAAGLFRTSLRKVEK